MSRIANLIALSVLVCPSILLVCPSTFAAEVTDIAPEMRGTVRIDYESITEKTSLVEGDTYFGQRTIKNRNMAYTAEFSPIDGLGLRLSVPTSPLRSVRFTEPYQMYFEPVSGSGTYSFGQSPGEDMEVSGKGGQGVYIGAILSPFSELFGWDTGVTWRLDIGYRTGTKSNYWTVTDGQRGASSGGGAFSFKAAFSNDKGPSYPYAVLEYTNENKVTTDVYNEEGTRWATGLELKPPSSFSVRSGVEIVAVDSEKDGSLWTVDLFSTFQYNTWGDVPSGIYLPYVLDSSRSIPVRISDNISLGLGLGLNAHITDYIGLRTAVNGFYTVPYQVEHIYPVFTSPDNYGIRWSFGVDGRFR